MPLTFLQGALGSAPLGWLPLPKSIRNGKKQSQNRCGLFRDSHDQRVYLMISHPKKSSARGIPQQHGVRLRVAALKGDLRAVGRKRKLRDSLRREMR